MSLKTFKFIVSLLGVAFFFFFVATVLPPLWENFDIVTAALAGFVNPFVAGYSTDVIVCYFILLTWIVYERSAYEIRYGWVCAVLAIVPGVAVGFALYLVLRYQQLEQVS